MKVYRITYIGKDGERKILHPVFRRYSSLESAKIGLEGYLYRNDSQSIAKLFGLQSLGSFKIEERDELDYTELTFLGNTWVYNSTLCHPNSSY